MITFSSSPNCSRVLAATPEAGEAAAMWTGQHECFRRKDLSESVSSGRAYFPVVFLGHENSEPEESASQWSLLVEEQAKMLVWKLVLSGSAWADGRAVSGEGPQGGLCLWP